jgi:chromosome partitioning protein
LVTSTAQADSTQGNATRTMRVIAMANQKGGVGKTTTTVNTGMMLATRGFKVLVVDLDPQGNATSSFGVDKDELDGTIHEVMIDGIPVPEATIVDVRPGLDLLPTTSSLAAAEVDLVSMPTRERRLKRALADGRDQYDVALIDCPPSLGLLTVNGLTAANHVIIPIQCEFLALEGVSQLITTIDLVKRQLNPDLDLLGVLMTMYDARTNLSASVVEEVRRFFPDRIFETIIPRSVRLAEAPSYGQSIAEYDPSSRGGKAYAQFTDELIERLQVR